MSGTGDTMTNSKDVSRIFSGNLVPVAGEYMLDSAHCFVEFIVQHLIVGQVWGRFDSISGMIRIAEDPFLSTCEVSIDTASISTHNEDRNKDLRSERFFDAEKFPKMTFLSTGIKRELGDHFSVDGNLTLHGVTRPVSLVLIFSGILNDPTGKTRAAFQAKMRVNRKDFGLITDLDRETGGLPIGKDVAINIAAEILLKDSGA
jgi:polyisoprenoid-binding protein YceI